MAPVPSAPAAPAASPIPLAGGDYATAAATANEAYQNALASINGQRQQALQQFGYTGTIDPATGQLTNMAVDPHNPYGQYQQLLSGGASDQAAVQAADMARGLGATSGARGGGLAAQGLTQAKLNFGGNSAALGENLMGTLGGLTSQQQDAHDVMNNALWQAELASAQNNISNSNFDPANFSGVTDQAPAGGNVPKPVTTTTSADAGTVPKTTKVTPVKSTRAGRGVRYRPVHSGGHNTFHRAVQNRHTAARRPRRGRR